MGGHGPVPCVEADGGMTWLEAVFSTEVALDVGSGAWARRRKCVGSPELW